MKATRNPDAQGMVHLPDSSAERYGANLTHQACHPLEAAVSPGNRCDAGAQISLSHETSAAYVLVQPLALSVDNAAFLRLATPAQMAGRAIPPTDHLAEIASDPGSEANESGQFATPLGAWLLGR
jgi:hypothetical protein